MKLFDPTTLEKWLSPHSVEWYNQLSQLQDKYTYPWESTFVEPNGETIFDKEVHEQAVNKRVLDIGCGDGEFTLKVSTYAKEIVGIDVTENFVNIGNQVTKKNVSFVVGNTKEALPFKAHDFDFVYIRKGPTTAYHSISKVLKSGGNFIGLHPGDQLGRELPLLFPDLFESTVGTPILDTLNQRLQVSDVSHWEIETINSVEYIHTPLDIIKLRCFGQTQEVSETVIDENLAIVSKVFNQNATNCGLPLTFSHYIVRGSIQ